MKHIPLQQSDMYARYMRTLKWNIHTVDDVYLYTRTFPLLGTIAKLHRPIRLPKLSAIRNLLGQYRIRSLSVEPDHHVSQQDLDTWYKDMGSTIRLHKTPYLPTKTRIISLTSSEEQIFSSFTSAKRRGVRRAQKHGVTVEEHDRDVSSLIRIKNRSAGFLGFITTSGIRQLWDIYAPHHATTLVAKDERGSAVGGILLLFWDKTAHYWIAGSTKYGKKLFAPTLLVWHAMRIAKKRGCTHFDFIGVWDVRLGHHNTEWKGFTKFKEGFGGKDISYPISPYLLGRSD